MSINPHVDKAFDALSGLQRSIDEVGKLKGGGEVRASEDGKVEVVQKGFFGRVWGYITGTRPDPEMNAKGFATLEKQCLTDLQTLQGLMNDEGVDPELRQQIKNSLSSTLKTFDPDSLKNFSSTMAKELERSAHEAGIKPDAARPPLDEKFADKFEGKAHSAVLRVVRFVQLQGSASKVESLFSNAFQLATGKEEVKLPTGETFTSAFSAPAAEEAGAPPPPPPPSGAVPPPPPPPMSPAQMEAKRKAEAEAIRQAKIGENKTQQASVRSEIGVLQGKIDQLSSETKAMQGQARTLRDKHKEMEKAYNGSPQFQAYERAARSIDTARQDLEAARSDLKLFEDANGPRIAKLQQFLDSGKGTLTITVSREVFNPDTKENERVREETTLKREQVVKMIKDDFEAPLAEKKEALERAESGLTNTEQVLKEYADKEIMGQPFKVFVKEFQRQAKTLEELETKVKQTNARKFEAQDQLKAASARLNMLEVELGKLENRTVAASVAKEAKVDMGELMAKVRTAVRVTLDDIEVEGAMRYGDAVAKKAAPKSEEKPVEDKENVPEQAPKRKMPKAKVQTDETRGFFRRLFRI